MFCDGTLVTRVRWPRHAHDSTRTRLSPTNVRLAVIRFRTTSDRPRNWLVEVNRHVNKEALAGIRQSATRGVPLGNMSWKIRVANRLGLDITLRPRGRPVSD